MASYEIDGVTMPNNDSLLLRDAKAEAVLPELVDNGAKNLIRFYESASAGGGRSAINQNGYSVTLSGSSSVTGMALGEILNQGNETYVFKYESTGTTGSAIVLYDYTSGSNFLVVSGSGSTEISNFDPTHRYGIHSYVGSAMTLNGTISAMICPKAAYDISQEFESYALPNPVLSPAVIKSVNDGAKNKMPYTLASLKSINTEGTWNGNEYTRNGIKFTVNSDMTITANGTISGASAMIRLFTNTPNTFGGMWLSGSPSVSGCSIRIEKSVSPWSTIAADTGNGATVTPDTASNVYAYAQTTVSLSNVTFKPMICTKNDWLISKNYTPPALTNAELTAMVNPSVLGGNLTDTSVQSLTNGRIAGYASTVASITGWVVVDTYVLNSDASRVMQVAQFDTGARKTRLYNGSWQSWV